MTRLLFGVGAIVALFCSVSAHSQGKQERAVGELLSQKPQALDSTLKLNLIAIEPEIVTPTGITVDEGGRVWVIENHTHQRAKDYPGPSSDRIRVFDDFDSTGKARRVSTFAEGFRNSMGLILGTDGTAYLATRAAIYRLRDTKGTGRADEQKVIVRLDTRAVYPHNGLSGFVWDALGRLYFGFGENEGLAYQLVGSDGRTLSGGGEGGSIYRCQPDVILQREISLQRLAPAADDFVILGGGPDRGVGVTHVGNRSQHDQQLGFNLFELGFQGGHFFAQRAPFLNQRLLGGLILFLGDQLRDFILPLLLDLRLLDDLFALIFASDHLVEIDLDVAIFAIGADGFEIVPNKSGVQLARRARAKRRSSWGPCAAAGAANPASDVAVRSRARI